MHDPMTVAFEIRRPWPEKKTLLGGYKYYPSLITIWHVDPETDGTDDSCDWFYRDFSDVERKAMMELIDNEFDNLSIFFGDISRYDQESIMRAQWRAARAYYKPRPWWQHTKWHILHWKIQVPVIQRIQRYLFSRCCKCGKRFSWGYSPMSSGWGGTGPRWFRGEPGVYHHECDQPMSSGLVQAIRIEDFE